MHTKQVTATHETNPDKRYMWTSDSKQTLAQWKAKRGPDYTFSNEEDNPEVAEREEIRAAFKQSKADPATKKLLKLLLKEYIEGT